MLRLPKELKKRAMTGMTGAVVFLALMAGALGKAMDASPEERVAALVANMTRAEKYGMVNGSGNDGWDSMESWYVGNTLAVPRLGIPSLNLQDAGQGFRTVDERQVGQVTSWSCGLGLASAWDPSLVAEWASATADEFLAKGANVVLGPAVNVHRVARGGRNAEYLSGEDPFLGTKFAPPYVQGFQDKGMLAVMKHFALNNQENNRQIVNSIIPDARTLFEVYYPPFQASVDAGVAAAMCSYNKVNGTYACENAQLLAQDLKTTMGFEGWVMSDWGATHSTSAVEGLDQDMPGSYIDNGYDDMFSAEHLDALDEGVVDEMVSRILLPMARYGALDSGKCTAGTDCDDLLYNTNATTAEHVALAERIATESVLLLQNEGGLLPLPASSEDAETFTLAIVGSACDAPNDIDTMLDQWNVGNYYVVGGSGRVIPASVTTIVEGLKERAEASSVGYTLVLSLSDSVEDALVAMEGADAAVVCGGATTTESVDRDSLQIDQQDFITQVAADSDVPTIVVAMTPGSVLTPWKNDVEAMVDIFLGGAATGKAIAAVLFGDHNPSAKSPVTFPVNEDDMVAPCDDLDCVYSEGLFVGYRALDGRGADVQFPFGHGLSYTSFFYSWSPLGLQRLPSGDGFVASVMVKNTGAVQGQEVAQLYLGFPEAAAMPPKVLKGFRKTSNLAPDSKELITWEIPAKEFSTWNSTAWDWQTVHGTFTVYIGSSSRDIRLEAEVQL